MHASTAGGPQARAFRTALGAFATGVTVVATPAEGGFCATTANSFASVSLDPPLVLVCLHRGGSTVAAILQAGVFSVNVLAQDQHNLSRRFADRRRLTGAAALSGVPHSMDPLGCPTFDGGLASFSCRVHEAHEGGDHLIVVGQVAHLSVRVGREPLLFHNSDYRALASEPRLDHLAS